MNYASFGKRFKAKAIDVSLYLVVYFIVFAIAYFADRGFSKYVAIIFSFIFLLYNILMIYFYGKTLGKMAVKIRVIKSDGSKSGAINAVFRETINIVGFITGAVFLFVFNRENFPLGIIDNTIGAIASIEIFVYFLNNQKKTLHDYIGGTVVITDEVVKYKIPGKPHVNK